MVKLSLLREFICTVKSRYYPLHGCMTIRVKAHSKSEARRLAITEVMCSDEYKVVECKEK